MRGGRRVIFVWPPDRNEPKGWVRTTPWTLCPGSYPSMEAGRLGVGEGTAGDMDAATLGHRLWAPGRRRRQS